MSETLRDRENIDDGTYSGNPNNYVSYFRERQRVYF